MKDKFAELEGWFNEIVWDLDQYVVSEDEKYQGGDVRRRYKLYTQDHVYSIVAVVKSDESDKDYLGCTASTRKSRPGETWNRGNDLPDGEFNKDTWNDIVRGILRYEILKLDIQKHSPVDEVVKT